jgi:hypothetical protein
MTQAEKLLQKALESPGGLRFSELCQLAENYGFREDRVRGSHHVYVKEGLSRPLNFQDVDGEAKDYQVRQLLDLLRELGLIDEAESGGRDA